MPTTASSRAVRALRLALAAAWLAAPLAALAQTPPARTPLTHEKLWMMKRVGAPAVSPDGKWAVYSVLEPSYEPDKEVSDLWVVASDGRSPPRRLRQRFPARTTRSAPTSTAT